MVTVEELKVFLDSAQRELLSIQKQFGRGSEDFQKAILGQLRRAENKVSDLQIQLKLEEERQNQVLIEIQDELPIQEVIPTTKNNDLRNALLIGGALLFIL